LVSIIISSYNYERYVGETIDSALNQTYPHVEVIVVDDGSSDGSRDVIRTYGDRVTAIFKPTGGQGSSANAGFEASRGELVYFLDSDDVLLPHAMERVVAAFQPGVTKVQFRLRVVDADKVPTGRHLPPLEYRMPNGNVLDAVLQGKHYPSPPTTGNVYRRDLVERTMPISESTWRVSIDTYMFTVATFFGEIASIDEPLALYRVHGKNHWALGPNDFAVAPLEKFLSSNFRRTALIREWAEKQGLEMGPHPNFQLGGEVARFLALKLIEPDHRYVAATQAWWLAYRGLVAIASDPFPPPLAKRLALALWFVAAGLLPRSLVLPFVRRTLFGQDRPTGTAFKPA
jgi:glycosyltransferase involved in cell wall biosynthesis